MVKYLVQDSNCVPVISLWRKTEPSKKVYVQNSDLDRSRGRGKVLDRYPSKRAASWDHNY